MRGTSRLVSAALIVAAQSLVLASRAETNMLFVLDGSNSMWGQIEGQAKITAAQGVLSSLLTDLPADTKVGLMVYGHRDKASCEDIELVSAIGADTPDALAGKIKDLQPKGKTPIAGALNASIKAFDKLEGQNNHVVLISDGIETCEGDPCAAAGALAQASIKARVHVVGFDVGAKERAQLECIPAAGNGKYFSASNANELKVAVAEVKQVAQAAQVAQPAEAPEKKPAVTEVFRDDFDGEELAGHWEVINPDEDAFIVEEGGLLMVSGGNTKTLDSGKAPNIFKLSIDLPKGDWRMTAALSIDFQTALERVFVGLYQDEKNYIVAQPAAYSCGNWGNRLCHTLEAVKSSKGKISRFEKRLIWGKGVEGDFKFNEAAADMIPQPILVRLVKEGRKYRAGILWKTTDPKTKKTTEEWLYLENFTVLRQKGKPAIGIYQTKASKGESVATVDWIKIEVTE